jgi:sulfide:quinone oxidoreductase
MARIVVLGGGISGHTAALFLRRKLGAQHDVAVITPNARWNWIPSNIWVGVGRMSTDEVTFPLEPVYGRSGIEFHQARAHSIHPEGDGGRSRPWVGVRYTDGRAESEGRVEYDWLINATGPQLRFDKTEGLGPDGGFTTSVCTPAHAEHASQLLDAAVDRMRAGQKQTLVIGTGHGTCTCQGAAFEYAFNVEHELRQRGVRDQARLVYLSNEYELGDFGMGGMHLKQGGYVVPSKTFAESLYAERGVEWITRAHVQHIDDGRLSYEQLDGSEGELDFDFAMLIPPFTGVGLKAFDASGNDITDQIFAPNGFMKVDADYTKKPYEDWSAADWPRTYQNPDWPNLFAVGIAFAPPHAISKPQQSPRGTPINPTPPRTGMPSAIIGKSVALSIADLVEGRADVPSHQASMAEMGAACVASAGNSMTRGMAAAMTVYPVIPDFERFPTYGRDLKYTFGEIGLGAHWIKQFLHYMFMYKARAMPGWHLIPE